MKILLHTMDKSEALSVKLQMELKGIPIFIAGENSGPGFAYMGGDKYTLWVCLNEQFADAQALLLNDQHQPEYPIDVAHYNRFVEQSQQQSANKNYDRYMLAFVLLGIVGFILWSYSRST